MRWTAAAFCLALLSAPGLAVSRPALEPIADAPGWGLARPEGAVGCFARLPGDQVDTMLTVNKDDRMVLSAGREDWRLPPGREKVTLQIDAGAPYPIEASPVVNVIFGLVADEAMVAALRQAQTLTWTLPSGRYEAHVAKLGVAFDAVVACTDALKRH